MTISADQSAEVKVIMAQVAKNLQAGASALLNVDHHPISIQVENLHIHGKELADAEEKQPSGLRDALWMILERLPEPKLEYLRQLAIQLCFEHLEHQTKIASFLGLSAMTVRQWRKGSFVSPEILKINP